MSQKSCSKSGSTSNSYSKKSYPPEVREKAVKLITELGDSLPGTPASNSSEVAQQLGCSTASVHRWQAAAAPLDPAVSLRMELGEDENKRLRKELARVKMENDILKKATAYFARDNNQRKTPASNASGLSRRRGSVEPGCNALALPPGSTSIERMTTRPRKIVRMAMPRNIATVGRSS